MNERTLRRLFTGILTATVGAGACSGNPEQTRDADAGFCSDDRPPEMRNYPGCAPPFCVEASPISDASPELDAAPSDCQTLCGPSDRPVTSCKGFVFEDTAWVKCQTDCTGRRPAGFEREGQRVASLGGYFAEMSRLEAASITAFRILARELRDLGAPRSLQRSARRAAREEIRHTRATRALAHRFGGKPLAPRIAPSALGRSLEAIAIENAREGCVRETFGALTAMYQSRVAADPEIRQAFRRIARDEVGHAALAWRVKRWTDSRLDQAGRDRVQAALLGEVVSLRGAFRHETPAPVSSALGLPLGNELVTLAEALTGPLWC